MFHSYPHTFSQPGSRRQQNHTCSCTQSASYQLNFIMSNNFSKTLQHQISCNFAQQLSRCYRQTDRHKNIKSNMTKLIHTLTWSRPTCNISLSDPNLTENNQTCYQLYPCSCQTVRFPWLFERRTSLATRRDVFLVQSYSILRYSDRDQTHPDEGRMLLLIYEWTVCKALSYVQL
jgi:hypothetical protein